MRLTKSKLKQIIKEELGNFQGDHEPLEETRDDTTWGMVDELIEGLGGDYERAFNELVKCLPRSAAQTCLRDVMQNWEIPWFGGEGP